MNNLDFLKVSDLKALAKSKGLRGYSKLRKAELIDLLRESEGPQKTEVTRIERHSQHNTSPMSLNDISENHTQRSKDTLNERPKGKVIFVDSEQELKRQTREAKKIEKAKKIDEAVEWGKQAVMKWGEWLKDTTARENTTTVELEAFKKRINELYKTKKRYELLNRRKSKLLTKKQPELMNQHKSKLWTPLKITKIRSQYNTKFNTYSDTFKISGNDFSVDDALLKIGNMVRDDRKLVNGDKIQWIISHDEWTKPMSTKFITITDQLEKNMVKELAQFIEYKNVSIEEVKIEIRSVKIPRGKGRLRVTNSNVHRKKCIITIKNDDSICLARSIVTAVANINKQKWTKSQLQDGFNRSRKLQRDEAVKLHEEAGVEINEFGSTLEDIKRFANHLKVQINVVDSDQFNDLIFTSENEHAPQQMIYLYKNNNHFDVITSMTAFLAKDYYCHTCKIEIATNAFVVMFHV